jgi:hypothetical protein
MAALILHICMYLMTLPLIRMVIEQMLVVHYPQKIG